MSARLFKAALLVLNDEERGLIRIKFNPWLKVQIPKSDKAAQRAMKAERDLDETLRAAWAWEKHLRDIK